MEGRAPAEGDFVRVASCATPTEAHLLKGMLEGHGLVATVADANIVQANAWMTQAVGGVRVLVPASQVEAARTAIDDFRGGAFELEGEGPPFSTPAWRPLATPVYSPERAALWSFLLTPAFGATLQFLNSTSGSDGRQKWGDAAWLALLFVVSGAAVLVAHRISPGLFVVPRAGLAIGLVTVLWYFLALQGRSRKLIDAHGPAYARRPTWVPALAGLALALLLGWALGELA